MARRSWRVGPDELFTTRTTGEQIPVVSLQAQIQALSEATMIVNRYGGTISALYGRQLTDIPGEGVTTEMLVTVQDRANAKQQPERDVVLTEAAAVEEPVESPVENDGPNTGPFDLAEAVDSAVENSEVELQEA